MDKKTIILVSILVILLIAYFPLMEFLGFMKPPAPRPSTEQQSATDSTNQIYQRTETETPAIEDTGTEILTKAQLGVLADSTVIDTIVVNTRKYSVTLSSFGGGPISIVCKEYRYRDGKQIEMLPGASHVTPEATFAGGTFSSSQISYTSSLRAGKYDATRDTLDLVYTFTTEDGGELKKRYRFYPNEYHYDFSLEVNNRDKFGFERQYNLIWNTPLGVTEPQASMDYQAMEAVAMQSGSREKLDDFDDGTLNQTLIGATTWAGVRSKYFAAVMIPKTREAEAVFARGTKEKISTPDGSVEQKAVTVGVEMPFAVVNSFADTFSVFVGPLDYTLMARYNVGLEDMLDIGTTPYVGWIIKPFAIGIIWLLPKLYSVIPNYGVVIILFALLVKLVTMPLSMKSFQSMNAMKELQPKIDELKKKHKNNPQALQAETMKMYKAHGVNPISGCLPMLPQMPLFFALFSVFRSTILLRDAPFFWFFTDLSRGASSFTDPYILLVVIMIAAQFVSQKFTMASTQQNKGFMYIMPLFMGFIFYSFAAGLVLYWTCFSIFSLIDYFAFKRKKNVEVKTA